METLKRYLIFLVGLFVNSLGVSLITKAIISKISYNLKIPMKISKERNPLTFPTNMPKIINRLHT